MAKKTNLKKRCKFKVQSMPILHPDSAGVDIGSKEIFVAVPPDRAKNPVRSFATFTKNLHEAAQWLKEMQIETIAMESTSVYWIPVFEILESYGFEVILVNARHVKNVPGRKSDVQDCQWLQYLHTVGLLRGSYRPPKDICAIRALRRHRENLVSIAGSHIQLMQKSLTQMNLQLHNVISDITGVTGLAILDAIVAGEHDPKKLVKLKHKQIRATNQNIIKSLEGHYLPEHVFTLKQSLESYRHYKQLIAECDHEIEKLLQAFQNDGNQPANPTTRPAPKTRQKNSNTPNFDLSSYLEEILGVDITQIDGIQALTAQVYFTEVGTKADLEKFPTPENFTSWLGLCPGNKISGGKVMSSKTRKVANKLSIALRIAARNLERSDTYLGNYYRRMKAKHGAPQGITATAHKLARIIYTIVKYQIPFDENIFKEQEKIDKERKLRYLQKKAQTMGYQLVMLR